MSNGDATRYVRFKGHTDLADEVWAIALEEYGDSGVVTRLELKPTDPWERLPGGEFRIVFKDNDLPGAWDLFEELED